MSDRIFKVAFRIAGQMSGDFPSAFKKGANMINKLRAETTDLRNEIKQLKKDERDGKITAEEFAESQKRINDQISKNAGQIAVYSRGLKNLRSAFDGVKGVAAKVTTGIGNAMKLGGLAAGTGAAYTVGSSINLALDYEAQLSSIKAVGNLDDSQMQDVDKLAIEVGEATKYSAKEAAQGMEELIKAGVSTEKIMNGALLDALNLATAGDLELAEAAEIMSTSLNAFNTEGVTSAEAANLLAGAAVSSATSVSEMNYGLSQVSASASMVGLSLKDVTVGLAVFANNGQKGSDAGTSFKTMLTRLTPVTKAQIEQFRELGLLTEDGNSKFYDANGELRSLSEIAGMLRKSLQHLNGEQRKVAIETMFGSDAQRAASVLYKEGAEGVEAMAESMQEIKVADVAAEKMNNAKGALEQLAGAWETTRITIGQSFLPVIKEGAETLGYVLEKNQDKIKEMALKMESSLLKIAAPLTSLEKPKFDESRVNEEGYKFVYEAEVIQYEKYKNMSFEDRLIESLDIALDEMSNYVDGDGAEKIGTIFTKLSEIAVKSFWNTFSTAFKTGVQEIFSGNIAAGAGMLIAANFLSRGLLGKSAGKGIKTLAKVGYKKYKDRKDNKPSDGSDEKENGNKPKQNTKTPTTNETPSTEITRIPTAVVAADALREAQTQPNIKNPTTNATQESKPAVTNTGTPKTIQAQTIKIDAQRAEAVGGGTGAIETKTTAQTPKTAVTTAANITKKEVRNKRGITKWLTNTLGKAAAPLAVVGSVATIATSENKPKAIATEGGALAGMAAGAKGGAVLGSMIAPGIGTAIGTALGGILGSFLGSKVGEATANKLQQRQEVEVKQKELRDQTQKLQAATSDIQKQAQQLQKLNVQTKASNAQNAQGLTNQTAGTATEFGKLNTNLKGLSEQATMNGTEFGKLNTDLKGLSDKVKMQGSSVDSLGGINGAALNVINALNGYAARLNAAQVPTATAPRRSTSILPLGRTEF